MKFIKLSIITLLIINAQGCTKESIEKVAVSKSTKELLQANEWVMTAYTVHPGIIISGDTVTDYFTVIDDCDKDGFVKFTNYDTIIYNRGNIKCLPNEDKEDYTRYILNNDTSMTEYYPSFSIDYTIKSINENSLEYTFESNEQNQKRLNTFKFEKRK